MRLQAVTIQRFRNFVDAQRIEVEPDVTALVGKNESGKTTVLKALHRLYPANGEGRKFDLITEYPRWLLIPEQRTRDLTEVRPVTAEFTIDQDDIDALATALTAPLPPETVVHVARNYGNELLVWVRVPFDVIARAAGRAAALDPEDIETLVAEGTLDAAVQKAKELAKELKDSAAPRSKTLSSFGGQVEKHRFMLEDGLELHELNALARRIPKFFYFSNYSLLPGQTDLTDLAEKVANEEDLEEDEQTVLSLLAHAQVAPSTFLDNNYDSRKAQLQAAGGDLSREVFKYWKANTDLTVVLGDDNVEVSQTPQGNVINHRILKIELRDARHGDVETNFATRSAGFQWFFSFFAAFGEYQASSDPVIVLLDEPGTSLHGEAQKDFIKFIFNELGASKQTVYTTHSQFMIDPTGYEKLRAVHDRATRESHELGVEVTKVSLSTDRATVLPIESALGYTISQHLFLGSGQHLLVEGSSDFVFLMRMSAYMESKRKTVLSPTLAIIPVGGVGNMPAFVALMGRRLRVSVLVDGEKSSSVLDRTRAAAKANRVPEGRIVAVSEVDTALPRTADIEDLFAASDYLKLYNWAFRKNVDESELAPTNDRIIKKLTDLEGPYDHALPAHALTENQKEFFAGLDKVSVERFAHLFKLLNKSAS